MWRNNIAQYRSIKQRWDQRIIIVLRSVCETSVKFGLYDSVVGVLASLRTRVQSTWYVERLCDAHNARAISNDVYYDDSRRRLLGINAEWPELT